MWVHMCMYIQACSGWGGCHKGTQCRITWSCAKEAYIITPQAHGGRGSSGKGGGYYNDLQTTVQLIQQ